MADAYEIQIAKAIVGELNDPARQWPLPFMADYAWYPVYKVEELQKLSVRVLPLQIDNQKVDRGGQERFDYALSLDIQAGTATGQNISNADMDGLAALAEAIHDFYRNAHQLAAAPNWRVIEAKRPEVYVLDRLYHENIWESYINVVVRGFK